MNWTWHLHFTCHATGWNTEILQFRHWWWWWRGPQETNVSFYSMRAFWAICLLASVKAALIAAGWISRQHHGSARTSTVIMWLPATIKFPKMSLDVGRNTWHVFDSHTDKTWEDFFLSRSSVDHCGLTLYCINLGLVLKPWIQCFTRWHFRLSSCSDSVQLTHHKCSLLWADILLFTVDFIF